MVLTDRFTASYLINRNTTKIQVEDSIQQGDLTKAEYRKIDPNRSWEVKADSHVFLFCIGRAEIKHVFGW